MEREQLWQAIKSDDLAQVKELIKQGIDVNSVGIESVKAVDQFAETRGSQAFQSKPDNKGDSETGVAWEALKLHSSGQQSSSNIDEKEKAVLDEKVEPVIKTEQGGLSEKKGRLNRYPVEAAIQYGRSEIVQVLLQAGAKINVEYLASLPFRSLTEEKEGIWTILCKERPVESVCVMTLAQSNTGQDEGIWLPLFNDLLPQEKVEVLTCLCKMDALIPVEWFLHKKIFCHSEIKEVLKNVLLCSGDRVHLPKIVKCLLTQEIILSEKDFDPLMTCLKLEQTDLVQKFLSHVPCLHLWNEDLCRELILVALKSHDCSSLEVLVQHMGSGVINSISLSSVIDICVKDRKGITLKSKMEHLLKNGYLIVDWDYLDIFETLARRKRFEQLKVVLSLLPLSTVSRYRDHFLKIAIKTQNVELVKRVKLICEESGERKNLGDECQEFRKVQDIDKNSHQVRHFKQSDKDQKIHIWRPKKNNYAKQVKSPLHLAVRIGHLELVKLFSAERLSATVLCDAVRHTHILEYLMPYLDEERDTLKRKVICKAANCNKNSLELLLKSYKWQNHVELDKLLELAIKSKKGDIAILLLEKNAKLSDKSNDHLLNLSLCHVDVLSVVLRQGIITVDENTSDGAQVLLKACESGLTEAVKILLSYGISPNIASDSNTPLLLAMNTNNIDLVKLLLKHPNIDIDKSSALDFALNNCNTHILMEIIESLKNNLKFVSPQNRNSWATEVLDIMKKLVTQCKRLSDSEITEIAALIVGTENEAITLDVSCLKDIIFACIKWNLVHFTEFLLQLGFKANDEVCCEYMMEAQIHGTLEMLSVLLKYLPFVFLVERDITHSILNQMIIRFALFKSDHHVQDSTHKDALLKNVLQLLLDKGAKLCGQSSYDETALSSAEMSENKSICRFIIERLCHSTEVVEQKADQCKAALICAVLNCDLESTQLLVKSGFYDGLQNFKMHKLCTKFLLRTNFASETLDMIKYLLDLGIEPDGSCEAGITPLHIAVYGNNLHMVKTLLSFYDKEYKGRTFHFPYDEWLKLFNLSTILQLAVKCGNFQMALFLLEEGCSALVFDNQNNSLLHLLCGVNFSKRGGSDCKERLQFIDKLLECGISVNHSNTEGMTPLLCTVMNKDAELVQILLDRGCHCDIALPQSISNWNYPGCTALHIACLTHQYSIVNTLLKAGASATKKDACKRTALHYTCRIEVTNERSPYQIMQDLMHVGVRMDPDLNDEHPVDYAACSNLYGIVHFLLSHDHDEDVFYKAIHKIMKNSDDGENWEKIVENLFRNVGHSNIRSIFDQSLEQQAAGEDISSLCVAGGNLSLYHTIVALGKGEHQMNINIEGHLHVLIGSKSLDMTLLHYILERGADVNEVNNEGRTPAYVACQHDQHQVLQILFKYGANVNVQDKYGWTPIHVCAMNQAQKCLALLLKHSKCVNQTTIAKHCSIFAGSTALMVSIISYPDKYSCIDTGYKYIIDLLLKHGANPNIADIKGNNAFHIAVVKELPTDLLSRVVKRVSDVNLRNDKRQSALHLAMSSAISAIDNEMIEFLLQKRCNPNMLMPPLDSAKAGDTILHLALRGLRRDLVEVFLCHGSDILVKNSAGESPVSLFFHADNHLDLGMICLLDLLLKAGASISYLDMTEHFKYITIPQQLLYLLLKSGCKVRLDVTIDEYDTSTTEQNAMLKLIRDYESHPVSLETLSANVVRQALKPNALYGVEKLPVPLPLRNIIIMKDVTSSMEDDDESCSDISEGSDTSTLGYIFGDSGDSYCISDDSRESDIFFNTSCVIDSSNYVFDSEEETCYKVPDNHRRN